MSCSFFIKSLTLTYFSLSYCRVKCVKINNIRCRCNSVVFICTLVFGLYGRVHRVTFFWTDSVVFCWSLIAICYCGHRGRQPYVALRFIRICISRNVKLTPETSRRINKIPISAYFESSISQFPCRRQVVESHEPR